MKKQAAFRALAMLMAALLCVTFLPAAALPETDWSEKITASDLTGTVVEEEIQAASGTQADLQTVGDTLDMQTDVCGDAVIGDTVNDNSDWSAGSTFAAGASVAVQDTALVGSFAKTSGFTPYDPLDENDDNDPFMTGGDAWIDRDALYYGAPATPTVPFSEWAANTSVVNTTGIDGDDSTQAFPDVDLISGNNLTETYISGKNSNVINTTGTSYTRYDHSYSKWGITFDCHSTTVSWKPNTKFISSATPFLYYSIEQVSSSSMAIALQIESPDGTVRWYSVTSSKSRLTVDYDASKNADLTPQIAVTEDGEENPIITAAQKKKGSVTACINLTHWLPTLFGDDYDSYTSFTYTVKEVRVICSGDAARLNYLYFAPSTGNTLMPQAIVTETETIGSSDNALNNGWESADCLSLQNIYNNVQITIDTTEASAERGDTVYTNASGEQYVQITIPVRRWYNVMRDARMLSFDITTQNGNTGDDAPTLSLWGNTTGSLGSYQYTSGGETSAYRYGREAILAIFGTGYYLVNDLGAGASWATSGNEMITAKDTDYGYGVYNRIDMLRAGGMYNHMIKSASNDYYKTAYYGNDASNLVGYIFVSAMRVVVKKGDIVTLRGTTMVGANAGINDAGAGILDGGNGIQPIIEPNQVNTEEAAANAPQLNTSEYTTCDLLTDDLTTYGNLFTVGNQTWWDETDGSTDPNGVYLYDEPQVWYPHILRTIPKDSVIVVTSLYKNNETQWGFTCYEGTCGWVILTSDKGTEYVKPNNGYSLNSYLYNWANNDEASVSVAATPGATTVTDVATLALYDKFTAAFHGFISRYADKDNIENRFEYTWFATAYDSLNPTWTTEWTAAANTSQHYNYVEKLNGAWNWNQGVTTVQNSVEMKLNAQSGGGLSVSRKLNIPLKQIDTVATDISLSQSSLYSGWPVLYYDFNTNLYDEHPMSIALTLDDGSGVGKIVYLVPDESGNLKLSDVYTTTQARPADAVFYPGNASFNGYISLKDLSKTNASYNALTGAGQSGYTVTGVYLYSTSYGATFRRLEIRTNDATGDKAFSEAINTNYDTGNPDLSQPLTMYDTINLVDVTVGKTISNAYWTENKGWHYASTAPDHGIARVSNVDTAASYTNFKYKLNNGNLRFDQTTATSSSTDYNNNRGIFMFSADRAYNTSDYKYLYFSYAVRDADGIGYLPADGSNGMELMIRYGSTSKFMSIQNDAIEWSTIDGWTDGQFLPVATGCIDLSRCGLDAINGIALWCRNFTGNNVAFHINYLVLSNREPTDEFKEAVKREITQYIYMMDNTGNRYSARFPTVDNITGEVRFADQRVNPLKVRRGKHLQDGTFYNGNPLANTDYVADGTTGVDDAIATWFYQRYWSGEDDEQYDDILDIYSYQKDGQSGGTVYDMTWTYSRWYQLAGSGSLRLDQNTNALSGPLLEQYTVENNVIVRGGIEPIYYTTYYNTDGGQMTYTGSAAGTGIAVNENNYYVTNTTLFEYYTWPTTSQRLLNPVRTGFVFMGWGRTPQTELGKAPEDGYLKRTDEKPVPGDDFFYAYWKVDSAYANTAFAVNFCKEDTSDTVWFAYTANAANDFLINLPWKLRMETGDGIVQVAGWQQRLADGTILPTVYKPGQKLMISKDVTLVPVIEDIDEHTVTITLGGNAQLMLVAGENDYRDPSTQNIEMVQNGNSRIYYNVPVNVRVAAIPAQGVDGYVWQCDFVGGNTGESFTLSGVSSVVVSVAQTYEFTAFTNMNLSYTSPTRNVSGVLVYSCTNVPVENRQMDFYAQVDYASIEKVGGEFVAAGTLYTKAGANYDSIKDDLANQMVLDETKLGEGSYSTLTKAVRQITASTQNASGQYRLSVTENNGNAVQYYTRAYCVYTVGGEYSVAYSDVIASAKVEALTKPEE